MDNDIDSFISLLPNELLISIFAQIPNAFIYTVCIHFNSIWNIIKEDQTYIPTLVERYNNIILTSTLDTLNVIRSLDNGDIYSKQFNKLSVIILEEMPMWGNEILNEPYKCTMCTNIWNDIILNKNTTNNKYNKRALTIRLGSSNIEYRTLPTSIMFACWFMEDETIDCHTHITHFHELSTYGYMGLQKKCIFKTFLHIRNIQMDNLS